MIVRNLENARESGRLITSKGWDSTRLILKNDGMGFSFHITRIFKGAELQMHYQNHLESVYCISGSGSIEDIATGTRHPVTPGTVYVLDKNDRHILRAETEMQMACVFNPPLHGKEVHDESGSYATAAEALA